MLNCEDDVALMKLAGIFGLCDIGISILPTELHRIYWVMSGALL